MLNFIILIGVAVLYSIVAISYFVDGKTGLAITFAAYALANYGLYLAGK